MEKKFFNGVMILRNAVVVEVISIARGKDG